MTFAEKIRTINFGRGDKHETDMHPDDKRNAPGVAADAWDQASSMELSDVAGARRNAIKGYRMADLFGNEKKKQAAVATARTMRRNMEKRINGL